jgi:hypothetical protein
MFGLASVYCEFEMSDKISLSGGKLSYCVVHAVKKCRERSGIGPSYCLLVMSDELHA